MGFPKRMVQMIKQLMCGWNTRLEVTSKGEKRDKQMDQHTERISSVGFCLTEVPVAILIGQSDGYMVGPPGKRNLKMSHSLFINDLKVYQQSHERLKIVIEAIVEAI